MRLRLILLLVEITTSNPHFSLAWEKLSPWLPPSLSGQLACHCPSRGHSMACQPLLPPCYQNTPYQEHPGAPSSSPNSLKEPRLVFWWADECRNLWIVIVCTNGELPRIPLRSEIKRMPADSALSLNGVLSIDHAVKAKGFVLGRTFRGFESRHLNGLRAMRTRYGPPSGTSVMKNFSTAAGTLNYL